jgi:hypothetical protein
MNEQAVFIRFIGVLYILFAILIMIFSLFFVSGTYTYGWLFPITGLIIIAMGGFYRWVSFKLPKQSLIKADGIIQNILYKIAIFCSVSMIVFLILAGFAIALSRDSLLLLNPETIKNIIGYMYFVGVTLNLFSITVLFQIYSTYENKTNFAGRSQN